MMNGNSRSGVDDRALFRAVFECALDAMILIDDQGRYVDANPAAAALFGLPREELLGKRTVDLIAIDLAGGADEMRQRLVSQGRLEGEVEVRLRDDRRRWIEYRSSANVVPGLHLSVVRDVTARREAERTAMDLAAIVEGSNDAIIGATPQGIITSWNGGAQRLYQYTPDEAIGSPLGLLIPDDTRDGELDKIARIVAGHQVVHYETRRRRKDGTLVDVGVTLSPVMNAAGRVIGVSKVARDLSERYEAQRQLKKAEEQLRHAQKMEAIGNLAGGIAHDFNNLLSVILSYAGLLSQTLPALDGARDDIGEIQRAAQRAAELTQQLLAFSRKQVLEPTVLDLNQTVDGLRRMLHRVLGEDIELTFTPEERLDKVFVDPGQIEQVIMNLVVNARDAMPDGGHLTLETANVTLDEAYAAQHHDVIPGRYVMLAVTDSGVGMTREVRERVFEPFFTTKPKGRGTGLGLSTVFGIVSQSGGHIWVYSEPGKGTTFKIYFPATARMEGPALPSTSPRAVTGTETILLVEDEPQVRKMMRTVLVRAGYQVLEAADPASAVELSRQHAGDVHLLLTDVVMPRMTGRQLAERLAPTRPGMKVLYVSGYTENSIVHHGILDPGIAFLSKPLLPESLLRKVREVLGG